MKLHRPFRRSGGFTLVELLVVIGIIALLISILLPALSHVREEANKAKCSKNLQTIADAMHQYSIQNNGKFPRTYFNLKPNSNIPNGNLDCSNAGGPIVGTAPTATISNSFGPDVKANSVTASIFLLVKATNYAVDVFVCPSSNATRGFTVNKILDYSNWEDNPIFGQTMSYSFNCPFPSDNAVKTNWGWDSSSLSSNDPLAADLNPGIVGGYNPTNNVTAVTHSSSTRDMAAGNSNNHKNKGQNVLYADSHVAWAASPFVGEPIPVAVPFNDNIYTVRVDSTSEGGKVDAATYPYDNLDTYLLPTDDANGF